MHVLQSLPSGFCNSANGCFLSATLQVLSALCYSLRRFSLPDFQVLLEALNLSSAFDVSDRINICLTRLLEGLREAGLSISHQNDAHETMLVLLDRCFIKPSDQPTFPFEGIMTLKRQCYNCKVTCSRAQNFTILTVKPEHFTIASCLKELSQPYTVSDVECDHCKKRTKYYMTDGITQYPDILMIHLDRVGLGSKTTKPVFIDTKLAMGDLKVYELSAVIYHIGQSADSGHYATLRRWDSSIFGLPSEMRWITVDDDIVNWETREFPGSQLIRENAYLVVYSLTSD